MKKPTPERRTIFVSSQFSHLDYVPLAEPDWLTLQMKLGQPLVPATRKRLTSITERFCSFSRAADSQKSVKEIQLELRHWRDITKRLKNIVWRNDSTYKISKTGQKTKTKKHPELISILDQYFKKPLSKKELTYPLAQLDRFLSGVIAIADHIERVIVSRPGAKSRETEIWFLWAAIVIAILKDAKIPVKHPKRNQILSGPVEVLVKLQATLPKNLQRRKGASLRKAAVHAFKISRGNPIRTMLLIFQKWGKGSEAFEEPSRHNLGIQFFLARFNKQIALATKPKPRRIPEA